jgi:RND family efflux transporter MFP subunit
MIRFLLLLLAVTLLAGCSKAPAARPGADGPAVIVQVAPVNAADLPVLTEVTGSVRAVQRATLAAKVMGPIARLPIALGQEVAAGDLLVEIAAPEVAARLEQARAQVSLTERELARDRALATRGVAPPEQVRALEDRLAIHAAQLREAETMLGYTQLRAPFAGVIARKHVDAGDLATPGQPLLELDGTGAFEIEVAVPDSLVGPLAVGRTLGVTVPATGRRFTAPIAELSASADSASRTVTLKLAVPSTADVRPGQFARVAVPSAAARTLLAPASAVTRLGQMERVFVVTAEQRAALRLVKTGAVRDDQIEILAGLDAGETVVIAPSATLREGVRLEVRP